MLSGPRLTTFGQRLDDYPFQRIAVTSLILVAYSLLFLPDVRAGDLSTVPLWDGETAALPSGLLLNRFGGNPIHMGGTGTIISHTSSVVHRGNGALQVDTLGTINAGEFGFFQTALSPSASFGPGRDLRQFDQAHFWLKNETGSMFTLKFEIKDYRDTGAHVASRNYTVPSTAGWQSYSVPLDLAQPGWNVVGSPDMERARFLGFVINANMGQSVNGPMYLDDMTLIETGGTLDTQTASLGQLAGRLAQRQFLGLWGSRNRSNSLIPLRSTSNSSGALNTTSAVLKMLPGAVGRGWVTQNEADSYVQTLVGTLNTTLTNSSTYLPPRYMNMVTLAPTINEESSVDAAFMALALHQYKNLPTTSATLQNAIDDLQNRFDFAAFSDTQGAVQGWKLAYLTNTATFTSGTYDGYSGEPWLISLAAELATNNHVDIETHYHSAVFRQNDFLVNSGDAHAVHSFDQFRAPFLQWLLPLFVDVDQRGVDTFPTRSLATNPVENAEKYQREVHAWFAAHGRDLLLQPDAGDDGSGSFYQQFSAYNDFGRPDLLMPWSVAFSLLGEESVGEAALRRLIDAELHGPLGLLDSTRWTTGAGAPYQITAPHDFWNTALSAMALSELLYADNGAFTSLPEVSTALDRVFFLTWDGVSDGAWNSSNWGGGMAPPTARHDAEIFNNVVSVLQPAAAHRTRVSSGRLHVVSLLTSAVEVHPPGALSGTGEIVGDVELRGTFRIGAATENALNVTGAITLDADSRLAVTETYHQARGTNSTELPILTATDGITGEFAVPTNAGVDSHLGRGHFLVSISDDGMVISADILAALPGDANGDRVVDGTDFILWNDFKFQSGTDWTQGDFNLDGVTDGVDFILWNSNKFTSYDTTPGSTKPPHAIPEPTALVLLGLGAAGLLCRR